MVDIGIYNTPIAANATILLEKQLASASLRTSQPMTTPPSPTHDFDTEAYNELPLVPDAIARFEKQLRAAGLNRTELFSELAPLFLVKSAEGTKPGPYAVFLIHRHFELEPGERMVENNNITEPSNSSLNIVPHIWLPTGQAIEFRRFISESDPPLPPPPTLEFISKFRSFLDKKGINTLGICYANTLEPGSYYLEEDGPRYRTRIVKLIHEPVAPTDPYEVMWIPRYNPDSQYITMVWCCTCIPCNPDLVTRRDYLTKGGNVEGAFA